MKIVHELPPNWRELCSTFDLEGRPTVFTYGDTIYNPVGFAMSEDLIRHEEVHSRQQNHTEEGAKEWWDKFIEDEVFRIQQEAEAYGAQYRFICSKSKNRERNFRDLWELAGFLSGPMYGNVIKHSDAMALIKKFSK